MTIKKWNDFVLGIIVAGIGGYLLFSDSAVTGTMMFKTVPWLARAETYIHCLGIMLALSGTLLCLRCVSLKKEREHIKIKIKKEAVWSAAALILFVPLYDKLGFFIPTFSLLLFLSAVYCRCEELQKPEEERMSKKRFWITCLVYSLFIVAILYICFTQFLGITFR